MRFPIIQHQWITHLLAATLAYLFYVQIRTHEAFGAHGLVGFGFALFLLTLVCVGLILLRIYCVRFTRRTLPPLLWGSLMLTHSVAAFSVNRDISLAEILGPIACVVVYFTAYAIVYSADSGITSLRKSMLLLFMFLLGLVWIVVSYFAVNYRDYGQQNIAYYLIVFLPWLVQIRNRTFRTLAIVVLVVLCLMSLKRTAILTLGLSLLGWALFVLFKNRAMNTFLKFTFICLGALLTVSGYIQGDALLDKRISTRMQAMRDDRGSGRLEIYSEVITLMKQRTMDEWLTGRGHDAVSRATREQLSAHNDFLEVTYDYGLPGISLYFYFICMLLSQVKGSLLRNAPDALPILLSVIIFLSMSMISHLVVYPSYFCILMIFWGSTEARAYMIPRENAPLAIYS